MQFKIARRNLIDVLDSYGELSGVEMAHVTAQNDYRDAALSYLRAQAQIFNWASNLTASNTDKGSKAKLAVPAENTAAVKEQPAASTSAVLASGYMQAHTENQDKQAAVKQTAQGGRNTRQTEKIEPFVFTKKEFQAVTQGTASVEAESGRAEQTVNVQAKPVAIQSVRKMAAASESARRTKATDPMPEPQVVAPGKAQAAPVAVPEEKNQAKAVKRGQQPVPLAVEHKQTLPGEVPLQPVAAAKDLLSEPQSLLPKSTAPGEQKLVPTNTPADSLDLYINDLIKQRPAKQKPTRKSAAEGDSLDQYINNFLQTPRKS